MITRLLASAAEAQHTAVPGERTAATRVHILAREVMVLDREIEEVQVLIVGCFREHPDAAVITSMPGIGYILGAEFFAVTGGDMSAFGSPDRLVGVAGPTPVPDAGKVSGNLRRPRRYSRRLLRMFLHLRPGSRRVLSRIQAVLPAQTR